MKFEFFSTDITKVAMGHVVIYPDSYVPTKKYPLLMIIHGMGERNSGTLSALHYLVDQYSWGSIIPLETQQATDLYDIIIVAPNYLREMNPIDINYVFDNVIRNYTIDESRIGLTGFSLGGGAVLRYLSSSQSNVDRLAIAVPVAPVAWYGSTPYIRNSGIPVWFHVNTIDKNSATNLNVTLKELQEINDTNPPLPAIYTAYNAEGHGGQNQAWGLKPPKAPGGQGLTDAMVNIYQWLLMNTNTSHKAVPVGTSSTTTTSTTRLSSTEPLAIAGKDIITSEPIISLDGRSSTNYDWAKWTLLSAPEGINIYSVNIKGAGYITAQVTLPKPGSYVFELKVLKGTLWSTDLINVVYVSLTTTTTTTKRVLSVLSRTPVPSIGKVIVIYEDGSIEYENLD